MTSPIFIDTGYILALANIRFDRKIDNRIFETKL